MSNNSKLYLKYNSQSCDNKQLINYRNVKKKKMVIRSNVYLDIILIKYYEDVRFLIKLRNRTLSS